MDLVLPHCRDPLPFKGKKNHHISSLLVLVGIPLAPLHMANLFIAWVLIFYKKKAGLNVATLMDQKQFVSQEQFKYFVLG